MGGGWSTPGTIKTSAMALVVSQYAAPIWARPPHAHCLDPELNAACTAITGNLKSTNVEDLYLLAGITPPDIPRHVCAEVEKKKQ